MPFLRQTRTIEVWQSEHCRIEREGNTVTLQIRAKHPTTGELIKQNMAMPLDIAQELDVLMKEATAIVVASHGVMDLAVSESGARNAS